MDGVIQTHNYQGPEYFCFVFFLLFFWKGGIFLVFGGWEEGKLKVFIYIVSRDHVNNSIQANNRN